MIKLSTHTLHIEKKIIISVSKSKSRRRYEKFSKFVVLSITTDENMINSFALLNETQTIIKKNGIG